MNSALFSFSLFLLWTGVAIFALVVGPAILPNIMKDSSRYQFLGAGAAMLAMWNLVRWWSIRSYRQSRAMEEAEQKAERIRRRMEDPQKRVVNPDFQFDDSPPIKLPPPPPPNGAVH